MGLMYQAKKVKISNYARLVCKIHQMFFEIERRRNRLKRTMSDIYNNIWKTRKKRAFGGTKKVNADVKRKRSVFSG